MSFGKGLKGGKIVNFGRWSVLMLGFRCDRPRFLSSLQPEVERVAADIECFTDAVFPFTAIDGFYSFLA